MPPKASVAEIKQAHRRLILLHHPDRLSITVHAGERAKRINLARDWLVDPALRDHYDRSRGATVADDLRAAVRRQAPQPSIDPWTADFGPRTIELRIFLRAVEGLSVEQVVALAAWEFGASVTGLRSFLPRELDDAVERADQALDRVFPGARSATRSIARYAAFAYAFDLLAGDWIEAESVREAGPATAQDLRRMLRQPWLRATEEAPAGPHADAATAFITRVRGLSGEEIGALLAEYRSERQRGLDGGPVFAVAVLYGADRVSYQVAAWMAESAVDLSKWAIGDRRDFLALITTAAGRVALGRGPGRVWLYVMDADYRRHHHLARRNRWLANVTATGLLIALVVVVTLTRGDEVGVAILALSFFVWLPLRWLCERTFTAVTRM